MEYKKYFASTLALMSAAALVSCDGDDVDVQQTSPDDLAQALADAGIGDPEALADALNGVGNLPVNAPAPILLPLSRISMIVEQISSPNIEATCQLGEDGPAVDFGQELTIDFESSEFADLYVNDSLFVNNGEVIGYVADVDGPNFSFSFRNPDGANSGSGNELLRDISYTVLTSQDKTLVGTFTTGSPICSPPSLNTFNYHDIAAPNNASAAFFSGANGDNIEVTNNSSGELFTLPTGTVIVRAGDDPQTGKVYVKLDPNDPTADDFDVDAANGLDQITYTEGSGGGVAPTVGTEFQELCVFSIHGQKCDFSGTFRLDMNPSQGGIDGIIVDGLNNGTDNGSLEGDTDGGAL